MAVDKKITELAALPGDVQATDVSILVRGGVDYQYTFTDLLNLINSAIPVGSVITFSNDTPDNSTGKNGDVVIKPASGEFWQRVAGTWVLQYTAASAEPGNTIRYGTGVPSNSIGINGDTFIRTDGGIFYKKAAGVYTQVFSMATGPAGATGAAGADGTNGTNGNTVLTGTTPPSNVDDGVNGDYYINKNTLYIYGPKAGGIWPAGVSIIGTGPAFKQAYNYDVLDTRFVYDSLTMELTFTLNSDDQLLFPYSAEFGALNAVLREKITGTSFKTRNSFDPIITDDGTNYLTVLFEGVDDTLINNTQIVLS